MRKTLPASISSICRPRHRIAFGVREPAGDASYWRPAPSTPSRMASTADSAPAPREPPLEQIPAYEPRYIDIGINLADPIFRGRYHGKERHPDDLAAVVDRARQVGCSKLIVTGSSFKSSRDALQLAGEYPGTVFTTAGIHPCSSAIFAASHPHHHEADPDDHEEQHTPACGPDPAPAPRGPEPADDDFDPAKTAEIIADLARLIAGGRSAAPGRPGPPPLVALGEFGLDYDRLHYCGAAAQRHSFAAQLRLAASLRPQLPLFLHSRAAHADFVAHLRAAFGARLERLERGGVVHSFTGTAAEARELTALGLYVGVNGCSLKTRENCDVVRAVPLVRLMLETDGPWCDVRPSHEGWKYLAGPAEPAPGAEGAGAGAGGPAEGAGRRKGKGQKKEPAAPERFKTVKKEKWEEGAMVKGRNEPCMIERVAKIVAGIKGVSVEEVCEASWHNTVKVFGLDG